MEDNPTPPPLTIEDYLSVFEQTNKHLLTMAAQMDICWHPNEPNPQKLHNLYVRNLITCYVSKFGELGSSIIDAVANERYLSYALCGRSLIEHAATLRYFVRHKYPQVLDSGQADMKSLIEVDDQHLRGTRFDWESFVTQDFQKLHRDALAQIRAKKESKKSSRQDKRTESVNVTTCIDKWSQESPVVKVVYDLFCDMVHPNIGSSFLVASMGSDGLYFSKNRGDSVGRAIFEQSFPFLVTTTQKPFIEFLPVLMATLWQDDELG